ncbi:MAG: hypothetical protein ACT4QC_02160 [Planctomycetaceae bacterium]
MGPSSKDSRNHNKPLWFLDCANPALSIASVPQPTAYRAVSPPALAIYSTMIYLVENSIYMITGRDSISYSPFVAEY